MSDVSRETLPKGYAIIRVPDKWQPHANDVVLAVATRLMTTARCANEGWHKSAPMRMLVMCAECPR